MPYKNILMVLLQHVGIDVFNNRNNGVLRVRAKFNLFSPCYSSMDAAHYTYWLRGEYETLFPHNLPWLYKFFKFIIGFVAMEAWKSFNRAVVFLYLVIARADWIDRLATLQKCKSWKGLQIMVIIINGKRKNLDENKGRYSKSLICRWR